MICGRCCPSTGSRLLRNASFLLVTIATSQWSPLRYRPSIPQTEAPGQTLTFVSWVQAANRLPRTVPTFAEVRIASRAVSAAVEIVLPDGVVVRGGDMESVITVANRLRRC